MQRRRHHDRADFSSLQFTLSTGACTASLPAAEILQTLGVRGGGCPVGMLHTVWYGKTRMLVWLPDGEKV